MQKQLLVFKIVYRLFVAVYGAILICLGGLELFSAFSHEALNIIIWMLGIPWLALVIGGVQILFGITAIVFVISRLVYGDMALLLEKRRQEEIKKNFRPPRPNIRRVL